MNYQQDTWFCKVFGRIWSSSLNWVVSMTPINFKRLSLGVAISTIHNPIHGPPLESHVLTPCVRIFFFFEASTGQEPKPHHLSGLISFSHHFLRALLGLVTGSTGDFLPQHSNSKSLYNSADKGAEKLEPIHTAGGDIKWGSCHGKWLGGSSKSETQNYHMTQQFC